MTQSNVVQDRITLAGKQLPSLIERLVPHQDRVLAAQLMDARELGVHEDLRQLQGRLLLSQLQSLGLFVDKLTSITEWRRKIGLSAIYERWIEESARVLEKLGHLIIDGDSCTSVDPQRLDSRALWIEWDARKREFADDPNISAQMGIVDATLRALPSILLGKIRATDILFPDASLDLVEGIYKHNKIADYFNTVLGDTVVEFVEALRRQDPDTRIRVLEIGAGTGGTSDLVFKRLKPYEEFVDEYCYSDISQAFLMHAKQAYGPTTRYLTTRLFNVEHALVPQGLDIGAYDLVIATNVLHATKNIRNTLRNAKAALKRHGLLLLNELVSSSLFVHLTFGLLEGWWLYEDAALRVPGSPAVSPDSWQRVLKGEGFCSVLFPARTAHSMGQQVILAESDGVIRQSQPDHAAYRGRKVEKRSGNAPKRTRTRFAQEPMPLSSEEMRDESNVKGRPDARLREQAIAALKNVISQALRIPVHQLDESESLEKYGIDSILVVKLTNALKEFFPETSSTFFFEHRTIMAAAEYFIRTQLDAVVRWVGLEDAVKNSAASNAGYRRRSGNKVAVDASHFGPSSQSTRSRYRSVRNSLPANGPVVVNSLALTKSDEIAIIGLSGRYPQARTVQEYWENLHAGRNCISEIPTDRWDHSRYFDPEKGKPGMSYSKWGGFVDGVDQFDPLFFKMSPREAERVDPQERLFLQVAYAGIEDAGYCPATLSASKKVGVYVGVMNSTYFRHSTYWSIANRVSHFCDFRGPSMAVDTACSSSLTAIHLAAESIRSGTCECAIAGGVNLIIDPVQYVNLSSMTMLSSDDRCRAFGDQADGFVDGEGVGVVVLKPLSRALIDGDHVYGLIKGSSINAGGRTHGYTVPNPTAQRELIESALTQAGIDPRAISYVEAHGTGTSLGDPIEVAGLTQAFSQNALSDQYCAIGSVKSNIGHLESAAGIAGVTKVLLQMRHRKLVPSLHSKVLNPHIDFSRTPFRVQQSVEEWKRPIVTINGREQEYPRIAGISSFGAGGANAHVILEEYEEVRSAANVQIAPSKLRPALIVLSAMSEERLCERVDLLLAHLMSNDLQDSNLFSIAYTLQVGREPLEHRLAFTAATLDELKRKCGAYVDNKGKIVEAGEFYRGQVKLEKNNLIMFKADEELQEAIGKWVKRGKYEKLLELWAKGLSFEWATIYDQGSAYWDVKPRRVSLPTYPFEKDRYWKRDDYSFADRMATQGKLPSAPIVLSATITGERQEQRRTMSLSALPGSVMAAAEDSRTTFSVREKLTSDALQLELREMLSKALFIDEDDIDSDVAFNELGMDSIVGVEWVRAINARYKTTLLTTRIYDYPTIRRLADFLSDKVTGRIPSAVIDQANDASKTAAERASGAGWEARRALSLSVLPDAAVSVANDQRTAFVGAEKKLTSEFLQTELREMLSKALFIDEDDIDSDMAFNELGMDSIVGVEWVRAINARYQTTLLTTRIYDYPTLRQLADFLSDYVVGRSAPPVMDHAIETNVAVANHKPTIELGSLSCWQDSDRSSSSISVPDCPVASDTRFMATGETSGETPSVEREVCQRLERELSESLAKALFLSDGDVDPEASFNELGLDSIIGVEWVRAINDQYRIAIAVARLYDHSNIRALAKYLSTQRLGAQHLPAVKVDKGGSAKEKSFSLSKLEDSDQLVDARDARVRITNADAMTAKPTAVHSSVQASPEAFPHIQDADFAIAVIGMSGAFPKASNLDEFWKNIAEGRDCISELIAQRWSIDMFYDADACVPGKTYSKWMGILECADEFDSAFFNIIPAEAEMMDPQQRLLLQQSWKCIEDAGRSPSSLSGSRCGVYIGCTSSDYSNSTSAKDVSAQTLIGNSIAILCGRVAYYLNLKGPCIAIDTACSSSLVAIASACDSLVLGRSDLALAGGVYVAAGPGLHIMASHAGMLSRSGRCYTFDARADGFVPGEGVGVILLKRLNDAVRDADRVHGVIRGWGINQDGRTNGITAPSMLSQAMLEKEVYEKFRIDPATISLVEAHGTGTKLGDPIEVEALTEAFQSHTSLTQFCALGSVKSNIGHAATAAGVASVLKVLLALRHRLLPPTINFESLNEHLKLDTSPFYVNREAKKWDLGHSSVRRAAVSSFGFSGTNAHLVIEEYAASESIDELKTFKLSDYPVVVMLSARNSERLKEQASLLRAHIEELNCSDTDIANIAYTLHVGRDTMDCRMALVARNKEQVINALGSCLSGERASDIFVGEKKRKQDEVVLWEGDNDVAGLLDTWIQKRKLRQLAQVWVRGQTVDWLRTFAGLKPHRVTLPTYAFAKDRYWVASTLPQPLLTNQRDDREISFSRDQELRSGPDANYRQSHSKQNVDSIKTLLLKRIWRESSITRNDEMINDRRANREHWVMYFPVFAKQLGVIKELRAELSCEVLEFSEQPVDKFVQHGEQVLTRVRALLQSAGKHELLLQIVVPCDVECRGISLGLSGLLRSARLEQPGFCGQLIELPAEVEVGKLRCVIDENSSAIAAADCEIRYVDGVREVVNFEPMTGPTDMRGDDGGSSRLPWRDGGVYLVTGGAGGLGLIVAGEIVNRSRNAKIILSGRSEIDVEKRAAIEALMRNGNQIEYRQLDVTDESAVQESVAWAIDRFGGLNGVIHAAGIHRDNFVFNKTPLEFRLVLAPKVIGAIHLDRATAHLTLDFMLLFSSVAGAFGNVGQGDYATGNAFIDRFADYRADLVKKGLRSGRTLSIGWPLWQSGGMGVDEATQDQMQLQGLRSMPTQTGLDALYQAWLGGEANVLVLYGVGSLMERAFDRQASVNDRKTESLDHCQEMEVSEELIREQTLRRIRALFSDVTKLAFATIDTEEAFEKYGIDSVMIVRLNAKLSEVFGGLSKTLFYEYPSLVRLSDYLAVEHRRACILWTGLDRRSQPVTSSRLHGVQEMTQPVVVRNTTQTTDQPSWAKHSYEQKNREPEKVAIIGMSGRYPQARNVTEYWENLRSGKDCIEEIPSDRWSLNGFFEADMEKALEAGKSYCKWGGFIDGFAEFDPLFFSIAPREAANMDPQERLFVQTSWEVLEDAGYTRERLAKQHQKRVGVFVGITKTGFDLYGPSLWQRGIKASPHTSFGSVANRVSYLLDLQGPSMPIDTMCSASLTAIHEACEHLARGECELAIAGGVNLYLHPSSFARMCGLRMLSHDGQCKSFGEGGNGFVPGEGVGALLLKPLAGAIEDEDHIYGVVRGTSINHGGKTNGYTVPNPNAQRELIQAALRKGGVHPRAISYVEAHGTGTELGDPIEITGLTQSYKQFTQDTQYCAIGSAKSNIGHLESAAGVAGVTKVLLQMQHRKLVPSLHAQRLNPHIDFSSTPFKVQQNLADWERPVIEIDGEQKECPRIAGISSFGAGGANAHVILEEYCAPPSKTGQAIVVSTEQPALILLSAKNKESLRTQAIQLVSHLSTCGFVDQDLPNVAYTLQVGRDAMEERLALAVVTIDELKEKLTAYVQGRLEKGEFGGCYWGVVKREKEMLSLFMADDELQEAIHKWIQRGKYGKLLELWVKGLQFDWDLLYASAKPRRISLPTYPFSKEQYWIDAPESAVVHPIMDAPKTKPATETSSDDARWLKVTESWKELPFSFQEQAWRSLAQAKGAQRILVLSRRVADAEGIKKALAQIWAKDANVLLVDVLQLSELSNPAGPARLDAYLAKRRHPDVVFYFSGAAHEMAVIGHELQCILRSSQIFMERARSHPIQFYYCHAADNSAAGIFQDGLSGLFRSIAMECPSHCYRSIEFPASASSQDYLAIVREWLQHRSGLVPAQVSMVRIRNGLRYATSLIELSQVEPVENPVQFRRGATYLMVGALGEVGRIVCRALARLYRPRFVFLSRRPPDVECQQYFAQLTAEGASVIYRSVDITDESQLAESFAALKTEAGTIHGVFHFARSVSDGPLQGKSFTSFQRTIAAKVEGTLNIDEITKSEPLDFFIVFSSMASFGIEGSADYAYATAFQNAFVRRRNELIKRGERAGKSIAFCWGQWTVDAYSNERRDARIKQLGFDFIAEDAAVTLMQSSLQEAGEVIGIMAVNDKSRVKLLYGLPASADARDLSKVGDMKTEAKEDSLLEALRRLKQNCNGDIAGIEKVLHERSYDELVELYDALAD